MKCIEVHERFGNLRLTQRPDLVPSAGQVRIRLNAASLNYRDFMMVQGTYNPKQALPLIPGSDGAGVIDALGEGVTEWTLGDRVTACFAPYFQGGAVTRAKIQRTLGGPLDGTFAEQIVLPATGVVATPDHLTDEEAATLPCAAVTAWSAIVEQGETRAGDVVLLQGTGGVSLFAMQFALQLGAQVIITSSSDDKLERAKALGATHTINYKTTADWGKAARALTGGRGVDRVVEVGGGDTLDQSIRATAPGGRIMIIGVLSGVRSQVLLTPVLMQNLRLQGVLVGSRDTFEAMLRAVQKPIIDRSYPLDQASQAIADLAAGKHFGKLVFSL